MISAWTFLHNIAYYSNIYHWALVYLLIFWSLNTFNFTPFSLLLTLITYLYRSYSKSICSFWHKISNYAFKSFSFVYLSELLSSTYFNADSILQ